jgi:hypothetical protein
MRDEARIRRQCERGAQFKRLRKEFVLAGKRIFKYFLRIGIIFYIGIGFKSSIIRRITARVTCGKTIT